MCPTSLCLIFFNDTATTEIYTLSLHDALPISCDVLPHRGPVRDAARRVPGGGPAHRLCRRDPRALPVRRDAPERQRGRLRSEEHTSELQSRPHLVCRLLLAQIRRCDYIA